MGFFKDVNTLRKMGNEARDNRDMKAEIAQMQGSMAMASQMLAGADASIASQAAIHGKPAVATVTAVRDGGAFINGSAVLELELLVTGLGAPFPVTRSEMVSPAHLGRASVGNQLLVKVGEGSPPVVWIDWVTLP